MIIRRSFCEDMTNNVRRIPLMKDEENLCVELNSGIVFLGRKKDECNMEWEEIHTGCKVDSELDVVSKIVASSKEVRYKGDYIYNYDIKPSDVIVLDVRKANALRDICNSGYIFVTQESDVQGHKNMYSSGDESVIYPSFSRVTVLMDNNCEAVYVKKGENLVTISEKRLTEGEKYNLLSLCPFDKKIYIDGKLRYEADELLNKVLVSVVGTCEGERVMNISQLVHVCDKEGYLYVQPFDIQKDTRKIKLSVVANRKLEVEVYNEEDNLWQELIDNNQLNKSHKIRLRIAVQHGDCVEGVYLTD